MTDNAAPEVVPTPVAAPVAAPAAPVATPPAAPSSTVAAAAAATLARKEADKAKKEIARADEKSEKRKEKLKAATVANAELTAKLAVAEKALGAMKIRADSELARLDEPTRAKVAALAGDDPAEQLRQIDLAQTYSGKAPMAPLANTAAPPAPAPAAPSSATPVREQYAALRSIADKNKRAASMAVFALTHDLALLPDR